MYVSTTMLYKKFEVKDVLRKLHHRLTVYIADYQYSSYAPLES